MAENPALGIVEIQLDRPRRLKFTFDAIRLLEKECGLNFLLPSEEERSAILRPNMTMLATMLAGELLHEDPGMTPSRAGALILEHGSGDVFAKVMEAYALGMGSRKNGQAATPDPQMPRTGSTSGPSANTTSGGATSGSSLSGNTTPSSSSTRGASARAGKSQTSGAARSPRSKST